MLTDNIEVFISYSHDSPEHDARVLALASRLRTEGIDAMIDQYTTVPRDGWPLWMEKQIRDARFVICVCTETYLRRVRKEETPNKGLGVLWESTIIYAYLYDAGVANEKFIPLVFERAEIQQIPLPLRSTTYYDFSTDTGYEKLYRRLTNQPETPAPPLGERRMLQVLPRTTVSEHYLTAALTANLVHPYALQANFTGRVLERQELTSWLANDERPIWEIVAMGGVGKSALAWYWVTQEVLPSPDTGLGGVMWWSFYEGESSFAKFVDEALKYVSGQSIDAERLPTTYDRTQELRRELQNKRVLFVLDGFERQLRAYARLDAAYQQDETATSSSDARACVDPIAARLLFDLATGTTRAKVLLTTRMSVSDLEDGAGYALYGVIKRELGALTRDDAIEFMRAQGVTKGTRTEIDNVCADYGYHPLSLRLLSGLIAHDSRLPGDIAAAPRHDVYGDLVRRQHHVLEQSYNALPKRERALLSRIAAFRSPMTFDALAVFNTLGSETGFETALEDLRVRGLLQRDAIHNSYDLHPIVRHYAYDRLTDKAGVHTRLLDYFATIPVPDVDKVQSIEDLAPVIELYHHTLGAGRYDEACDLYYQRIWDLVYYHLGAYQTQIELLRALVPDSKEQKPRLRKESDQAWTMSELANAFSASGQPRNAIGFFHQVIAIYERLDKQNLAIGLNNIAGQQISLGALAASERNLRRSIALSREIASEIEEAAGHQRLGQLLAYLGDFNEAERELICAQDAYDAYGVAKTNFVATVRADRALSYCLQRDYESMTDYALMALKLALAPTRSMYGGERDIIRGKWLVGSAMVMQERDLNEAANHITDALTRCRRISLVEVEPDILLAWARWHRARGIAQEAPAYAAEALAIADRCEYRLAQADIHNFLARLALDAGDRASAREHAAIAKERALCDGPPHCYKPALDEAEKMLEKLGAKE